MGSFFSCLTEDVKLTTPFGSCSCGKSACGCLGKNANERQNSDQQRQQAMEEQIQKAVTQQLSSVEQLMKTAITNNVKQFGVMPVIHVLERGIQSPPPSVRALTVRVSEPVHMIEQVLESDEMKESIPIAMKLMELI